MSITRNIPPATFILQGVMTGAGGVYALIGPKAMIGMMEPMGFSQDTPLAVIHSSGLQLTTMGIYFMHSATQPRMWRRALAINTGLRLLAAYFFWNDGVKLRTIAMWEVFWAALNIASIPFVETEAEKVD